MTCQHGGTWFRLALPVLVAAVAGFAPLRAQEPAAKKPIPDAGSLQQALTLVEEVYGDEFKRAKDVAQKTALAEKLLQKARESAAEPTSQYALLKVAKDIAALAGDADLALRAVDDMAATFEIGTLPAKVETLLKAAQAASQTKQYPVIVGHAAALIELAVQQDDFDTAGTLSQTAMAAARKCGDSDLVKKTVARGKETGEMASAYAAVRDAIAKLKTDPVDAEANLAVGKYRCLVKGEWERGISYLALGSDPTLKELAIQELKGVSNADGQVALGDGWWDLAAASEGVAQQQLQGRAAYWYRKVLPGLTGLGRDKAQMRLEQLKNLEETRRDANPLDKRVAVVLGHRVEMNFILIPPGEFLMGSQDSVPQHHVKIRNPFYLGEYEVTQAQWQAVMGYNPSQFKALMNPVEQVSWYDVERFLERLNKAFGKKGLEFSLPSEAQWEYACRAGRTTEYSFGDDAALLAQYAWFRGNSNGKTHPVGQLKPNPWGLYDMHGNVFEWCSDWYGKDYYAKSPSADPTGPVAGTERVVRGGSWYNPSEYSGAAFRFRRDPKAPGSGFGFRVALSRVGR